MIWRSGLRAAIFFAVCGLRLLSRLLKALTEVALVAYRSGIWVILKMKEHWRDEVRGMAQGMRSTYEGLWCSGLGLMDRHRRSCSLAFAEEAGSWLHLACLRTPSNSACWEGDPVEEVAGRQRFPILGYAEAMVELALPPSDAQEVRPEFVGMRVLVH